MIIQFYSNFSQASRIPKTSFLIFLFAFFSFIRSIYFDSFYDVYFLSTIIFGTYFFFLKYFSSMHESQFFKSVDFVLVILLFINFTQIADINLINSQSHSTNNFYYFGDMPKFIGDMNPINHQAQSFIPIFGLPEKVIRVSGLSGTPYSSSALIAAIGMYFYLTKNMKFFYFAILQILLMSVATSILVMMIFIFFIERKKPQVIFLFTFFLILGSFILYKKGGIEFNAFLELNFSHQSYIDLIISTFIGEGKWNNSVSTEIRIIETFFSIGIISTILMVKILLNYFNFFNNPNIIYYKNYYALWIFTLILIACSFHYQTFFLFPNILFFIVIVAFAGSRNINNTLVLKSL